MTIFGRLCRECSPSTNWWPKSFDCNQQVTLPVEVRPDTETPMYQVRDGAHLRMTTIYADEQGQWFAVEPAEGWSDGRP